MFTSSSEAPNSLLDRYTLASKAGFKAVECAFPYELTEDELTAAVRNNGLEQIMINSDPGKENHGFAAVSGRESSFKESLLKSLSGCKKLHIMSGLSDDHDD